MPNINLTGLPLDAQAQNNQLQIQQAIAQALMQQSMQQNPAVIRTAGGNPYGYDVPNIGDPLANVASAMQSRKIMDEVAKKQGKLAEQSQRTIEQDITRALMQREGQPAMAPGSGEETPQERIPGNYNAYVRTLSTSRSPALQKMGEKAAEKMGNPQDIALHAKDYKEGTLEAGITSGDMSLVKSKPVTTAAEGAVLTTHPDTGVPTGKPTAVNTYTTKQQEGVPVSVSDVTGQAKGLSGGNTTPDRDYQKQYNVEMVKQAAEGKKAYLEDINRLQTIAQVREQAAALPDSSFGTAAGLRNAFGRLYETATGKQLSNTDKLETLHSELGKFLLEDARKFAPVTKEDLKTLAEIRGTEGYTKRGLLQMMDVFEAATARSIVRHKDTMEGMALPPDVTRKQHMQMFAPEFTVAPISAGLGGVGPRGNKIYNYNAQGDRVE